MLRTAFQKYAPDGIYRMARSLCHKAVPMPATKFVKFDAYFGDVEKQNHTPAYDIPTPEAPGMTFKPDARHLQGSTYTVPEDFTATLDEVLVSPVYNVVLTKQKEVVTESSNAGQARFFSENVLSFRKEKYLSGHCALLRSRFHNYYHLLIDVLPRLLALDRSPHSNVEEIKLLCPGGPTPAETFLIEKLGLKNLRVVSLEKQYLYRVEHLIFTPIKTQWQSGYVPQQYVARLRDRLWPKTSSAGGRRLFVSREKARRRTMTNHDRIMEVLKPLGFERVVMEDLSLAEQIETLHAAEALVGSHGAGLTNMLFARPGLRVVEIFPTYYMVPHYFYLSKTLEHEYVYQCGTGDDIQTKTFEADVSMLEASLNQLGIS